MMSYLYACIIGFILDFILGDPEWMKFHPVRLIGGLIAKGEQLIRPMFPKNKKGEFLGGMILALIVISFSTFIPLGILYFCHQSSILLQIIVEAILCYFIFATRSLKDESMKVYRALTKQGLAEGRQAVSMIVGRDVDRLDETGVAKATVETIAENTSDGIIAPMFFMMLGGAPLGYFYKAINTMDSMIGYKNEQYMYFGRFAARLDDVVNFIPARLSALFMIVAAYILPGFDGKSAITIYQRDRKKSASPNAAQTESVCAGALQVQLLGDAYYFGKLHTKPYIGEPQVPVTSETIVQTNRLLYATVIIGMCFFCLVKLIVIGVTF